MGVLKRGREVLRGSGRASRDSSTVLNDEARTLMACRDYYEVPRRAGVTPACFWPQGKEEEEQNSCTQSRDSAQSREEGRAVASGVA